MGLAGIGICDHNEVKGALEAVKAAKGMKDIVVIPGIEVSTELGHVLVYNVKESIPARLTVAETIEKGEDLGGYVVAAHPYRYWSGIGEEAVRANRFHTLEIHNGHARQVTNRKAEMLAKELGTAVSGGSDAHSLKMLGASYTEFSTRPESVEDVLEAIRKKRVTTGGKHYSNFQAFRTYSRSVIKWFTRGMKRM